MHILLTLDFVLSNDETAVMFFSNQQIPQATLFVQMFSRQRCKMVFKSVYLHILQLFQCTPQLTQMLIFQKAVSKTAASICICDILLEKI